MPLTLSQARQKLYRCVSPTVDTSLFTERLNSALERIYNSGRWKGLLATVGFNNVAGANWFPDESVQYITLPRQFQSVLGIQFGSPGLPAVPRQVYPRWQEFIAGGSGQLSPGTSMQMAVDMGDDYPVFTDPTLPFNIAFETTDADDAGKIVKFDGVDSNGSNLTSLLGLSNLTCTLAAPGSLVAVSLPVTLGKISSFVKPVTQGFVKLYAVDPNNSSNKSVIAIYEPTETVAGYKRYRLGAAEFSTRINCLCKRRFVSLVDVADENTVIVPGNEGALKLTLLALQYEDKNDMERAETYFNKAIQLLNAELKQDMGNPVITLQMNPIGAAMRIPNRF